MKFLAMLCISSVAACASQQHATKPVATNAPLVTVPFRYEGHLLTVPVNVGGQVDARFVLDTGIGLNLLSRELCEKLGCVPAGSHVGKRMSGQALEVELAKVSEITFGDLHAQNVVVGVIDMKALVGDMPIEGFLSLGFFDHAPFTVDYAQGVVVLDTQASVRERARHGASIAITIDRQDAAVGISLGLQLPGEQSIAVVVDTGSNSLILDDRFMAPLGISSADPAVRKVEGVDETSYSFERHFANISGPIALVGQPSFQQTNVRVMFQDIIYEGLVGDGFLRQFVVTYDLPNERMVFAPSL